MPSGGASFFELAALMSFQASSPRLTATTCIFQFGTDTTLSRGYGFSLDCPNGSGVGVGGLSKVLTGMAVRVVSAIFVRATCA